MNDHVYKKLEVVGSSKTSFDDAIKVAITRAGESVKHMRWFEVSEMRGEIENGEIGYYQATVKIGFTIDD